MALPEGLLLAYYGDDFTGSTDVMESLSFAGVKTVLFLAPPSAEQIAQFEGVRAIGVAGRTRSMAPDEMADELRPVFEAFESLGPRMVHYKTCSTFDSSPEVGSIGRAIDVGQSVFQSPFVPLVVGAPSLRRYCVFGNLFASSGLESDIFRLDRHPTMRHHPITPMDEADVRLHLNKQTDRRIDLFDVLQLQGDAARVDDRFGGLLATDPEVVLFDTLHQTDLETVGRLIWAHAQGDRPLFVAGSSGAEYALTSHWRLGGALAEGFGAPRGTPVSQIVVVSGSCSPVTARQIRRALDAGFAEVVLDTPRLVTPEERDAEIEAAVQTGCEVIASGRSVILHAGCGPDDPRIAETTAHLIGQGVAEADVKLQTGVTIGEALADILSAVMSRAGLMRGATTGGDTSFYIARRLGIVALEAICPMAPGGPLCRVSAPGRDVDGKEIVFKGGQVGVDRFFEDVLRGRPR